MRAKNIKTKNIKGPMTMNAMPILSIKILSYLLFPRKINIFPNPKSMITGTKNKKTGIKSQS